MMAFRFLGLASGSAAKTNSRMALCPQQVGFLIFFLSFFLWGIDELLTYRTKCDDDFDYYGNSSQDESKDDQGRYYCFIWGILFI